MNRVPPEFINLDNEMEDFMAVRRGIVPCGEAHAEPEQRQIWSDAHLRVHFQQPKPRWTWKAVGYLILAFGLAVWLWYEGLN